LNRVFLYQPTDADRSERRRLLDCKLAGAPKLEQREKCGCLLEPRQLRYLGLEVEFRAPAEQRAEPLEELRDRREAQRHVRQGDVGRILCEQPEDACQRLRILLRERDLDLWRQRSRAEPEEAVALRGQPLAEPGGCLFGAPVLGEPSS
jgi:hypothetical protein